LLKLKIMNKNFRKLITAGGIGLAATLLAFLAFRSVLFERWEKQVQDLLFRNLSRGIHPADVVIVAIDQNSLDYFQNNSQLLWPWPRDIYGLTCDFLTEWGAKLIAFDIIFSSPDIDRLNVSADYADAFFAAAMRRSAKVILAVQMEDSSHISNESLFSSNLKYVGSEQLIWHYPNVTLPIAQFQQSMALPGAVNFFTDNDGICRRIPLLYDYRGNLVPYMALAAAAMYNGDTTIQGDSRSHQLILGERQIPIAEDGSFEIYWYGAGGPGNTFTYVSYAQLIHSYLQFQQGEVPEISPELFKNKAVFVGATAAGLLDLKTTPLSSLAPYPGVEIYATLFTNILRGDFIRHYRDGYWFLLATVVLILLCICWQYLKIRWATLISILAFLIPIAAGIGLFQLRMIFFPIVRSEIALVLSVIGVLVVNYLAEGREKAQVKKVFIRYLHPAVVENLTQDPGRIKMGGSEIEATVMFTDLQGFTSTSELYTPHEIVQFLNDYFEKIETIIFQHEGMLDKYTGDGVMAIFGAPLESAEHALKACRAIIDFRNLLKMEVEKAGKQVKLITRVGVNSGNLIVGNIGSRNRMDYTAIGDTVNLSARLEGVNKIYGSQNLISENTYNLVKDQILCREIDYIRVKGRDAPLKIFTVITEKEKADNEVLEFLSIHHEALEMYRQHKLEQAIISFSKLLQKYPADPVATVFISRCRMLLEDPHLIDEKGIFNITVK
jgi:adenylate cyclase